MTELYPHLHCRYEAIEVAGFRNPGNGWAEARLRKQQHMPSVRCMDINPEGFRDYDNFGNGRTEACLRMIITVDV